jgi:hypothetical protein
LSQEVWYTPIIVALRKLRQEDRELEAIWIPCFKTTKAHLHHVSWNQCHLLWNKSEWRKHLEVENQKDNND